MGANAGDLSIAVGADFTKFQADFAKGTAQAEQSAARTERAMSNSLTRGARDFTRVIETAVKGMIALEAVAATVKFSTAAMRGDFEGMEKVVDSLPFGIGRVAESLRPVVESLFGINGGDFLTREQAEQGRIAGLKRAAAEMEHQQRVAMLEVERQLAGETDKRRKSELEMLSAVTAANNEYSKSVEAGAVSEAKAETVRRLRVDTAKAKYDQSIAAIKADEAAAERKSIAEATARRYANRQADMDARRTAASVLESALGPVQSEIARLQGISGSAFMQSSQTAIGTFNVASADAAKKMGENSQKVAALMQTLVQIQQQALQLQQGGGFN